MPRAPAPGSILTAEFVQELGRAAYLWAWPMVNIYNRHWTQGWVKTQTFLVGGVAPVAPINRLGMLTGSQDPGQRYITCPSQDLIYGFGVLDLSRDAVVVQVGTDYYTRTAVAKSNIFINRPAETRYFYQDLDANCAAQRWLEPLHGDLQGGPAGQGLLVDHPLRQISLPPAERDRPLRPRHQEQATALRV